MQGIAHPRSEFKQIKKLIILHFFFDQQVTLNKILIHKSGLTSIGSCIVSNLVKSRIIALEVGAIAELDQYR